MEQPKPLILCKGEATGDNTVTIEGSTTDTLLHAVNPVVTGDNVWLLKQGNDQIILGPNVGENDGGQVTLFTPTWNNVTVGTGATNQGRYLRIPGGLWIETYLEFGTSPSVSGFASYDIPGGYTERGGNFQALGGASLRDGTLDYVAQCRTNPAHDGITLLWDDNQVTTATPYTVAAGDIWYTAIQIML